MVCAIPLFSGSSGNAAYVGTRDEGFLIDAGVSCRKMLDALRSCGISDGAVKGVVVTHSHSDHVRGLTTLLKKLSVPVYSAPETLDFALRSGILPTDADMRDVSGGFTLAGMDVTPFETPHDARPTLGFRIEAGERVIGYATDLGVVTETVREHMTGCHLAIVESNYEPGMLEVSPYPYALRRRIASSTGHLSNGDCAAFVCQLAQSGTGRFVLAHLSRQNNAPEIARRTTGDALSAIGMEEGRDYTLQVAEPFSPLAPLEF